MKSSLWLKKIAAATLLYAGISLPSYAVSVAWVGDTDNDLVNPLNWTADTLPAATDTWQINGTGTQGNKTLVFTTLSFNGIAGTGTGKMSFGASAPSMTLSGTSISFFNGTNDSILLATSSTSTMTVNANLILGDGTTSTVSITNSSTSGGLLKVTGDVQGGTGAITTGTLTFSLGSTSSNNGNYEITGNISKGGASAIVIKKLGTGTLTLGGVNTAIAMYANEAGGTIKIAGGYTTIANGAASNNGWGGGSTSGTVQILGGTLEAQSARNINNNIIVNGGLFIISSGTGGSRLSQPSGVTFRLLSGDVVYSATTGGNLFGVRFGGDNGANSATGPMSYSGAQTGGTFTIFGGGGIVNCFSLGHSGTGYTVNYGVSGGLMEVRGSNDVNAYFTLGSDPIASGTTTFNLSGAGKLVVRANPAGATGINGAQTGARQVFQMTGGTLVAGRIDATNLRGDDNASNGTFVNNGGVLEIGDSGLVGKMAVVGGLTLSSGTLSIELGGTSASTIFREAGGSGKYDNISVTGALTLGGDLALSLVDGFLPSNTSIFTIATAGSTSGAFANLSGGKVLLANGLGQFDVTVNPTSVTLSNFLVIPEPSGAALVILGVSGMILRRVRAGRSRRSS